MPPPPRIVTRAPSKLRPTGPVHELARAYEPTFRKPANIRASACSATGSAYTPLPHVQRRCASSTGTKFSIPAKGSCTQSRWECATRVVRSPSTSRDDVQINADASAASQTSPPPATTASTVHDGEPSGPTAMRRRERGGCGTAAMNELLAGQRCGDVGARTSGTLQHDGDERERAHGRGKQDHRTYPPERLDGALGGTE